MDESGDSVIIFNDQQPSLSQKTCGLIQVMADCRLLHFKKFGLSVSLICLSIVTKTKFYVVSRLRLLISICLKYYKIIECHDLTGKCQITAKKLQTAETRNTKKTNNYFKMLRPNKKKLIKCSFKKVHIQELTVKKYKRDLNSRNKTQRR